MKSLFSRSSLLLMAIALSVSSNNVFSATVSWNNPDALNLFFSLNVQAPSAPKYYQLPGGGISAGRRSVEILAMTDVEHTTAVFNKYYVWPWLQNPGDKITVWQDVLRQPASSADVPFLQLGLVSDLNERMDGGTSTNSYASMRLMPSLTSPATGVRLQVETKVEGGSPIQTDVGGDFSLMDDHWYRFETVYEYESSSSLLVRGSLRDLTSNQSVFSLTSMSIPLSGAGQINGDNRLWPAFRAFDEGGANRLGFFSAIPEPATLSLLGVGFLFLRGRRR